jgi:hypothetical protein
MMDSRCSANVAVKYCGSRSTRITSGAATTSSTVTASRKSAASVITRFVYAVPPSASLRIARTSCGTSTVLNTPPASRM